MPQLPFLKTKTTTFDIARVMRRALEFHHQGQLREAEPLYEAVLAAQPDHFDALQMLGVIKLARGDLGAALNLCTAASYARPNSPQALLNYGMVLNALNRHEDALASFDQALRIKGRFAEAHNNRGSVLSSLGRDEEALDSYRRALGIKADYPDALYNQGNAQRRLGRLEEAQRSFERALALQPNHVKAHNNRGIVLAALERPGEALASYDRALAIQPLFGEAHINRLGALRSLKRHDEALESIDRLLAANPDYAEAHHARGMLMSDFNRTAEAVESYKKASALKPGYTQARFAACFAALPILYSDEAEIETQRADYERRLRALCAAVEAGQVKSDPVKGLGSAQPFFLAYQGQNDRDLQRLYGDMVCRMTAERFPAAELAPPPAAGEPVRVGIVSGFFWQHSVWKVGIKGWISQLDRRRFEVNGYHTGSRQDEETAFARERCQRFVQGPMAVDRWRKAIAADRPHVLIYPEIGMNAEAAELATLRLAPVQCGYIGHPQTSGFPTIDYFLSGELIEPPDGQQHYTEQLVRLPNIAFYYRPLELAPATMTREELGLRPASTAFWCAQSLFKYLPQHDEVFPRIAREVGDCQFVFIRHHGEHVTLTMQARLERAFAAHGLKADDHCVFINALDMNRFQAASAICDAMLDSIGWSGGNTTLEALAQDLPVVTFQGALMRGRVSAGMLRMMGLSETIAETIDDYVALAARMAKDADWRTEIKRRIAANKDQLYYDHACIAALEDFLDRVARPAAQATA